METALNIAIKVLSIIGTVLLVLQFHRVIIFLAGFFKTRKYPKTDKRFKYGICIAARNEEKVIENLLQSIAKQDYPLDMLTVFVIAHNCTDNTAEVCRQFSRYNDLNVVVYEYNNKDERTKGYALKYLFEKIKEDYTIEGFDGYFVFDADNVLNTDYITRMNEAFASGNKIITSFRNSKNIYQNWISFQYAIHWMRTCLAENRGKSILTAGGGLSCRVQGTGFLFANELVKDGWKYLTLTEDRAFCSDATIKNYNITYCEQAVFYDEQPYQLKVAFRQRIRWAKGHLLSSVENCPKLLKNLTKFDSSFVKSYDCFWLNFPRPIESAARKLLSWILRIIVGIIGFQVWGVLGAIGLSILYDILKKFAIGLVYSMYVSIFYRKRILNYSFFKSLKYSLLFFLFDVIGDISNYIALFTKVEWKPIPHNVNLNEQELKELESKALVDDDPITPEEENKHA